MGMPYMAKAYTVMACMNKSYSYCLYSQGLYGDGQRSDGLYSYGLCMTIAPPVPGVPVHMLRSLCGVACRDTYTCHALYKYGLYCFDRHSRCLHSSGLNSYRLHGHGLYIYGLCGSGYVDRGMSRYLYLSRLSAKQCITLCHLEFA